MGVRQFSPIPIVITVTLTNYLRNDAYRLVML